jgi:hypothetical protein
MKSQNGTPEEIMMSMTVDNYLNFLWRVAYAHLTLKTITIEDLDAFGFYFYKIHTHIGLSEYCRKEGFDDIIEVAKKLEPIWLEADARNASYSATLPDIG